MKACPVCGAKRVTVHCSQCAEYNLERRRQRERKKVRERRLGSKWSRSSRYLEAVKDNLYGLGAA